LAKSPAATSTPRQAQDLAAARTAKVAAILAKGTANLLAPGSGMFLELFGTIFQDRRQAQYEEELELIKARLAELEFSDEKLAAAILDSPAHRQLIFDGLNAAGLALSKDRLRQIAEIVAVGLTEDEHRALKARRMLALLGQIDDEQVIILEAAYKDGPRTNPVLDPAKDRILRQPAGAPDEGVEASRQRLIDYKLARFNMSQLGLVEYGGQRVGEAFEQHSDHEYGLRVKITELGKALARTMGLDRLPEPADGDPTSDRADPKDAAGV